MFAVAAFISSAEPKYLVCVPLVFRYDTRQHWLHPFAISTRLFLETMGVRNDGDIAVLSGGSGIPLPTRVMSILALGKGPLLRKVPGALTSRSSLQETCLSFIK